MYLLLLISCICVCVLILIIYWLKSVYQILEIKKKGGQNLLGKRIAYNEIPGRTTSYVITVEVDIGGQPERRKIYTTDRLSRQFIHKEEVNLLYIEDVDKLFWKDENDTRYIKLIIMLSMLALIVGIMSVGFILSTVVYVLN